MSRNKYKEPRVCKCGYSTEYSSNWCIHKKSCTLLNGDHEKTRIEMLERENILLEKDKEKLREQLSAKDRQIEELIKVAKKPRTSTVHNTTNKYVVEQHINVFGKESIDHITPEQIQTLLEDPANAVSQFIKLKHRRAPGGVNKNVRVPNQKRAIYQVVVPGEEGKEWENQAKGDVLEQLYDENSGHLEIEADEDTRVGYRFLNHQEKVKDSMGGQDGGRRYKEQLDKIHCVMST